jgi:hypothetical protein
MPGGDTIKDQTCHAKGCVVSGHTPGSLQRKFRGFFCASHVRELQAIRKGIYQAKEDGFSHLEVAFRAQERTLRRYEDTTHSLWVAPST